MKTHPIILALALGASTCLLTAQDSYQRPEGQRPPGREGGPGGFGNARGGPSGIHLLPPRAQEELKLTETQEKQIVALEAEMKAKLEKILTPEQFQQLNTMRPPGGRGRPGGGPGYSGRGNRPQRPLAE